MDTGPGSALLLAKRESPLTFVAPGDAQATGNRSLAQHLHSLDGPVNRKWRVALWPDLAQRANDTIHVGMMGALIPRARALRKTRVVANRIERRLQQSILPRLRILRHEEY